MSENPEHLAERLLSEGLKTAEFFRSLTPEQLERRLYAEGSQWTVSQVLAHFVTTETGFSELIEDILAGGTGVSEDFDIDTYNEHKISLLRGVTIDELSQRFIQLRQIMAQRVRQMKAADLLRMGRHPFLGMVSLEEIVKLVYRHNQIHQRDVRKLLLLI